MSNYETHALRQSQEAEKALAKFLLSARGDRRAKLKALPDKEPGAARFSDLPCDVALLPSASVRSDISASVDHLEDSLEEKFELEDWQAIGIAAWHRSVVQHEADLEKSLLLNRIVSLLIRPAHDIQAVIYGLCLAAGLSDLNGLKCGADIARRLGKHRASISYWKRTWQKLLGLKNETYGKSDEAKEKYRTARYEVLNKTKKHDQ